MPADLYTWPTILFTGFAQTGLTAAERVMITEQIRHFPPSWSTNDGVLYVNYIAAEFVSGQRAAWIAGGTIVYGGGPYRAVSIGVTWHELWHMGQLDRHLASGGAVNDHSSGWPAFLFTALDPSLRPLIQIERPEVEWEPTWIGKLLSPGATIETARENPSVARAALTFMDTAAIRVPVYVREAVEAAPPPEAGPNPAPPPDLPTGDLAAQLHSLSLEVDTRFAVVWATIEQMKKGHGVAIEDVDFG